VGGSWRCDETYIKVKAVGHVFIEPWTSRGRTLDFMLSEKRDVAAAKRFFRKAMKNNGGRG
jgi:putative transposase